MGALQAEWWGLLKRLRWLQWPLLPTTTLFRPPPHPTPKTSHSTPVLELVAEGVSVTMDLCEHALPTPHPTHTLPPHRHCGGCRPWSRCWRR